MPKSKKMVKVSKFICILVVMCLAFQIAQTIQTASSQSEETNTNSWAINLTVQGVGQTVVNTDFAPFEQIELLATVTYGGAPHEGMLVSFKVQGPNNSSSLVNITRIESTDSTGVATFTFHIPPYSQSGAPVVGTWQATATAQTTTGVIEKTASFNVNWHFNIDSVTTLNSMNQQQTIFQRGSTITIRLELSTTTTQPTPVNVSILTTDSVPNEINQTTIQNAIVNPISVRNELETTFKIPSNATLGGAATNATIYIYSYQNEDIQGSETTTAYFTIAPGGEITPNALSNYFVWLLLATGLLTFMLLLALLRRRNKKMKEEKTKLAPTVPLPHVPIQQTTQPADPIAASAKPQNQLPTQAAQPSPRIASARYASATTADIQPNPQSRTTYESTTQYLEQNNQPEGFPENEEAKTQIPPTYNGEEIEVLAKRIQALKAERQKIANDLANLRENANSQADTLETDITLAREEIVQLKDLLGAKTDQIKPIQQTISPDVIREARESPPTAQDGIISKAATTFKEELNLLQEGFEYVTEINGAKIFKRKEIFVSRASNSVGETKRLIEDGYEYVTSVNGTPIFRKRAQYSVKTARTIEEARRLAEAGYDCIGETDSAKFFRKSKNQ